MKALRKRKWPGAIALTAVLTQIASRLVYAGPKKHDENSPNSTTTPIKHLIVLIGENRTFDHTFATYQPKHGQTISNLLSRGIIDANGSPGPNAGLATQNLVNTPLPLTYFISSTNKTAYSPLPPPQLHRAPTLQHPLIPSAPFS